MHSLLQHIALPSNRNIDIFIIVDPPGSYSNSLLPIIRYGKILTLKVWLVLAASALWISKENNAE